MKPREYAMNTSLECMPCFMKMALSDARLACPGDEAMHRAIVSAWGRRLGDLDLTQPPPAIARHLVELVESMTGCGDLYLDDKRESNERVLRLLPGLRDRVAEQRAHPDGDPLSLALELAVIGNYIDRGVELEADWEAELSEVSAGLSPEALSEFATCARTGADVLILGDNCGEIVLDTLLVQELKLRGCRVTYAVRSRPVINDATMADAIAVGMTGLCAVVESGVDTPGTVLDRCAPEFIQRMREADVILSKGQGNFEALQGRWPGVFCAFKAKCPTVAAEARCPVGTSVLMRTTLDDGGEAT
ncbi:MAG: ARMT1-like domain-containing protein [Pseudodesulfovibrio sp.]